MPMTVKLNSTIWTQLPEQSFLILAGSSCLGILFISSSPVNISGYGPVFSHITLLKYFKECICSEACSRINVSSVIYVSILRVCCWTEVDIEQLIHRSSEISCACTGSLYKTNESVSSVLQNWDKILDTQRNIQLQWFGHLHILHTFNFPYKFIDLTETRSQFLKISQRIYFYFIQ